MLAVVFVLLLTGCALGEAPPQGTAPTLEGSPAPLGDTSTPAAGAVAPAVTATPVPSPLPSPTLQPSPTPTVFLPMPRFGVEPHRLSDARVMGLLLDSGARLVRYAGVSWDAVEPSEGVYNWEVLSRTDAVLQELAANGIDVILTVRGVPLWAQKVYGHTCGPVAAEKLPAFAGFMAQLVQRYSQPPYSVRYWELGNEPDVDPSLVRADSVFGCWGDKTDPYYGGGYYAEMLKAVYPAIKTADPQAQVLNGGLLLDCDPTHPQANNDCHAALFFEGILRSGGGDYLDIVNFHGYPLFVQGSLMMDAQFPGWAARGGVVAGKVSYLREVMSRYGVEKPIFHTETSLLCAEWNKQDCKPPGDAFYQAQAAYVVRGFLRNWALGVQGAIWYDFEGEGWRYASLVGADFSNPKPAYRAFQYLTTRLAAARMTGPVQHLPGVDGYDLLQPDGLHTWVLWSQDETPQTIFLPPGVTAAWDALGNPIPLTTGPELEITLPTYIDFVP
ncbi:MAG: hypothetical protein Fur0018_01610 [Anaerolineales bacterium]